MELVNGASQAEKENESKKLDRIRRLLRMMRMGDAKVNNRNILDIFKGK